MKIRWAYLILTPALALTVLALPSRSATAAVAPGCTSSRPTWLGGVFRGSDGRSLNAHIGVVLKDRNGVHIQEDGTRRPPELGPGYSYVEEYNPSVPPTGTTATTAPDGSPVVREWGRCVAANATLAFVEIYPKRPVTGTQVIEPTDHSRYGLGVYYRLPMVAGQRLDVLMRTPLIYQLGGNTGGVQGYITYNGLPVPPEKITRVRAFTHQSGAVCGVEGMAAKAERLHTGTSGRTYYLVDFLAAGQCGATSQTYSLRVTCVCGSSSILILRKIDVVRGRWPRVDIAF